jgi:CIC family chloride channel protein
MYLILGIIGGFFSVLYLRYTNSTYYFFKKKLFPLGIPQWLIMIVVGLLVGISGYYYKDIFGIGYSGINNILTGKVIWEVVLVLLVLKFILVPLMINSGGFGGMFAPSLFMGASLGFLFANGTNYFLGTNLDSTTYILVGMGTMLGGINTIPITAILMIFEMTQDYSFILPLMLAVIVSTTISRIVQKSSIHLRHLEEQGYQINEGRERNILKSILIRDINLKPIHSVSEKTRLPELIEKLIKSPGNSLYVINENHKLSGVISEVELRPIMTEYENVKDFVVATDIANPQIVTTTPNDNLDHVLRLFGKIRADIIPVVSNDKESRILGSVSRSEVLEIYNRETLKANLAESLSEDIKMIREVGTSSVVTGYSITEISVSNEMIGKSLRELKIRSNYGLEVLMIKHSTELFNDSVEKEKIISADPDYKLKRGDTLVLFGKDENIKELKKE